MANCTHDCSSCGSECGERSEPQIVKEPLNQFSSVKKVIGVVSGKGGVGKSMVTSLLAVTMKRKGNRVAILDADITGPSIPKIFGINKKATATETAIFPEQTSTGIDVMSVNLLLNSPDDPVVWRGPVIAGVVTQFWKDVIWEDEDYMFIDMPPGTGDVPLTVFQSIPIDGIIIVTSPQELVSMIVGKAAKMAELMDVPVLGIVENMSYYVCPDCSTRHKIFGDSHIEEVAARYNIEKIAKLPLDSALTKLADEGKLEEFTGDWLDELAESIK